MIRTVDYSALTAPVNPAEVKAFRESKRSLPQYSTMSSVLLVVLVLIVVGIFGIFALGFLGAFASFVVSAAGSPGSPAANLVFPVVFFVGFLVIAFFVVRAVLRSGKWERWMRFDRFASANGLVFSPLDADPQYPGTIFQLGRARAAVDHLRSASDRFLDYGNYRYTTGSGKNQTTRTWGFMALQLDRALPNMVLDSKANNGLFGSNLPATFSKDQVLHLEGDFGKHFTLYCPKQYERDALYVFTPDLMALLIDAVSIQAGSPFDVEIVDKWMFVYSSAAFDLRQPALHRRLLGIVDTVGAKALSQTERYADERVGDVTANIVAPQGRRLTRRISIGAVVAVAVFAVFWLWQLFGGFFTALFSALGN